MKNSNFLTRLAKVVLAGVMVISSFTSVYAEDIGVDAEADDITETKTVSVNLTNMPLIDIVMTKGETALNVSSFKEDLQKAIQAEGADLPDTTKFLQISTIETNSVSMAESFSWNTDQSSSIGSITLTNNGMNVSMIGNRRNAGKQALYTMPATFAERVFNFDYSISFGDSFASAGMLLKLKQSGNTLTGYALNFAYRNGTMTKTGIYKITYKLGANGSKFESAQLVQSLNISNSGNLNVVVKKKSIEVSGGGLANTVKVSTDSEYNDAYGYGFFGEHYSHNCEQIGSFTLKNINLQETLVKDYADVLGEPNWRDN